MARPETGNTGGHAVAALLVPGCMPTGKRRCLQALWSTDVVMKIRLLSFVVRTTGVSTLTARLHYFQAISGNRLACLPLELGLRGKSTRQKPWHADFLRQP